MITRSLIAALAWTPPPHQRQSVPLVRHRLCNAPNLVVNPKTYHSCRWSKCEATFNYRSSVLHNVVEEVMESNLDEDVGPMLLDAPIIKGPASEQSSPPPAMKLKDAISIIAGTAIGGGFLALPSVTTPIGYVPSVVGLVGIWSFLVLSSIAFVDAVGLILKEQGDNNSSSSEGSTSVATVIRCAFGNRWALLGSLAFIAQMFAVVTAQVVKGAQLSSKLAGVPYIAGVMIPTVLTGLFAFGSKPEVVEQANTVLTAMMIGGFLSLIVSTLALGNTAIVGSSSSPVNLFQRADWTQLIPSTRSTWALPVFINLLCFGQAMPLVVGRMVQGQQQHQQVDSSSTTKTPLKRARLAAVVGAVVPLTLSVVWAAIATTLISPTSTIDPIFSLLQSHLAIAIPVALLSIGAIGTTLLGSFLAMGHFAADVICQKHGYCSRRWKSISEYLAVCVPCLLACAGPGLYIPLLAFAGAYPSTILYGLTPSLAALVLRKRAKRAGKIVSPSIVPGGQNMLLGLAAISIGLVGTSTVLALRTVLGV